jgi:large subunit ribosomal protein L21
MIAVIHTGGKQYLVSPGEKIIVEKLEIEVGKSVSFDEVLLFEDDKGKLSLGTPYLEGVKVVGKVLEIGLGEKVRVFKYKPKTRYKVKQGHRQPYTEVEIEKITTK